jgi:cyclic beta-1,2-glucan synthetase
MTTFAAKHERIKVTELKLKNHSSRLRRLSVTSYVEWVLGVQRSSASSALVSWYDNQTSSGKKDDSTGVLFATNYYNNEFAEQVAFTDISGVIDRSFSCDRKSFIGRNGSLAEPEALKSKDLDKAFGSALDPCGALRSFLELGAGEEVTLTISLGSCPNVESARALALKYRDLKVVHAELQAVNDGWEETLGTVTVTTPDTAMNISMNRWLLYQTISCRLWARSAFYQSGGAFGFRDQLQDVMSVTTVRPDLTRQQILIAAARQFPEGDVQHWWHPPTGRGVRTSFSDDLLWLPYVVANYVNATGDRTILDELVPFIDAPVLGHGEESSYTLPNVSSTSLSVLEHCLLTIDRSLKVGKHNLPLMGCGDWNDGMNRVGIHGSGESIWMGWFLYKTIKDFLPVIDQAKEPKRFKDYEAHLQTLAEALDSNGWDGDWYRRAYFDNGEPLGSTQNNECRIDSIAQSWSVLSEAAPLGRARQAMAAVDEYLIDDSDGLIKLFTPPFDKGANDPGYIKGYLPGVRENGGQYTHAAIWTVMAIAKLGNGNRASELYALLNPINHTATVAGLHKYRVEPYVIAADIYGMSPHVGRGGWTWYTGSASWMYRAGLECILGFQIVGGNKLRLAPCIPTHWHGYQIRYRHGSAIYFIEVKNPYGVSTSIQPVITVDGARLTERQIDIELLDDQKEHAIVFEMV